MKYGFVIIVAFLTLSIGCRKEEDFKSLIDSYYYFYMHYPRDVAPDTVSMIYLEYSGGKVVKRKGGIIATDPASGYRYVYFGNLIDELIYSGNEISIKNKSVYDNQVTVSDDSRIIHKDNFNRMTRDIYDYQHHYYTDTTDYKYSTEGSLVESRTHGPHRAPCVSLFYYNSKSNLDSIITTTLGNDMIINKMVEIFTEYDNAPNPLKHLIVFKETFHRALSENNYREYHMKKFDSNNNLIGSAFTTWNFPYDKGGNPVFNKRQN